MEYSRKEVYELIEELQHSHRDEVVGHTSGIWWAGNVSVFLEDSQYRNEDR